MTTLDILGTAVYVDEVGIGKGNLDLFSLLCAGL